MIELFGSVTQGPRIMARCLALEKAVTGVMEALNDGNLPALIDRMREETDAKKSAILGAAYLLHEQRQGRLQISLSKTDEGRAFASFMAWIGGK